MIQQIQASPFEEELGHRVEWLIKQRWLAVVGVFIVITFARFFLGLPLLLFPLYSIVGVLSAYNLVAQLVFWRIRRKEKADPRVFKAFTHLQIVVDWTVLTLLIHFSGGIENPFLFYFVFHMIIASILLSFLSAYLQMALAITLFSGSVLLEYFGIIPHYQLFSFLPENLYQNPSYVFSVLFVFASTMFISVFLATPITGKLNQRNRELMVLKNNLQKAYEQTTRLYAIAETINSSLKLDEVLDLISQNAAELMGVKAASLRVLEERGEKLLIGADYGLSEEYLKKGPVEVEKSVLDQEVLSGKTVVIDDAAQDSRFQYPEAAKKEGIGSVLCVPLKVRERIIGVVRVYASCRQEFTKEDIELLEALASQSAIAIENARAYKRLAEADRQKTEFFMRATHELKAPLAAIQSLLKVVLGGYSGENIEASRELIGRAEVRVEKLLAEVRDLLDLSLLKGELPKKEKLRISMKEMIEKNVEFLSAYAKERDIKIEPVIADKDLWVNAAESDINLILTNLMNNAINYSTKGEKVTVELSSRPRDLLVKIEDHGIGISEEDLPKIFQDYYRGFTAQKLSKEGTGLGLTIVKEAVERCGGGIWVESEEGKGSRFYFSLPRAE